MKKVLVVDDKEEILNVISMILDSEGYEVKCTYDGNRVPDMIQSFSPDIILLDVWLGDIDGRDICKDLKNDSQTSHIPLIMISASHDVRSSIEKECKADDFIAKPFEMMELVQTVGKYVN